MTAPLGGNGRQPPILAAKLKISSMRFHRNGGPFRRLVVTDGVKRKRGCHDGDHRLHRVDKVLLTFITKDMRHLRCIGILSNVAFIGYGALAWLSPVLCLHLLLLPLNIMRLMELQRIASVPGLDSVEIATS